VWSREIAGRRLTFHLAGINNQNFLMRDDETGTYWQQISGRAISGPLAGQQLALILSDELSYKLWCEEEPGGTVLANVPEYASLYEAKDWDVKMKRTRTVIEFPEQDMKSRDLVLGIQTGGASRGYLYSRVIEAKLVKDRVGAEPVLLVVGPDRQSVRAFRDRIAGYGDAPDFYRLDSSEADGALMMDAASGSRWNFQGCAISGKANGACLERVAMLKDYWFDWRNYHPATTVWGKGGRQLQ
jgi:Protein of unknown function (DUF3179)